MKKIIFVICLFLITFSVQAKDAITTLSIAEDDLELISFSSTATRDGGYIASFIMIGEERLRIIKYSATDEIEWDVIEDNYGDSSRSNMFKVLELDNGNFMVISSSYAIIYDANGNLVRSFDIDIFNNSQVIKCISDGNDAVCMNSRTALTVGRISEYGEILAKYEYGDDQLYPVSLFFDNNKNIVVSGINSSDESSYIYAFNTNLNLLNKKNVNFNNLDGEFIVLGQFVDGKYLILQQKEDYSNNFIKIVYYSTDSGLNQILNEHVVVDSFNATNEDEIRSAGFAFLGSIINFTNSPNIGKYFSTYEFETTPDQKIQVYFAKYDSNMKQISRSLLINEKLKSSDQSPYFSSSITLKNGSGIAFLNFRNDYVWSRRFRIEDVYDVSFINDSFAAVDTSYHSVGDVVKINIDNRDNYVVDEVIVKDSVGNLIEFNRNDYTFIMPNSDVIVDVHWRKEKTIETIIKNPETGSFVSTLLCIIAIMLIGILNYKYFKKKV